MCGEIFLHDKITNFYDPFEDGFDKTTFDNVAVYLGTFHWNTIGWSHRARGKPQHLDVWTTCENDPENETCRTGS